MTEDLSGVNSAAEESVTLADVGPTGLEAEVGEVETPEDTKTDGEQVKRKKPSGWLRKINKLERENAELRAKTGAEPSQTAAALDKKPLLNDYKTYDEYNEALTDWKVDQKLTIRDENAKKAKQQEEANKAVTSWQQKVEDLVDSDDAYDDYEDVVGSYKGEVNSVILQFLREADIGPKLAYHLGKNPEIVEDLNGKTSYAIAKEMAKIEASLSNPTPSVKISKSPPPINPVKGSSKTMVKLDALDTDAYLAQRYPHLLKK